MRVRSSTSAARHLLAWALGAIPLAACATAPAAPGPVGPAPDAPPDDPALRLTATLRLHNPRLACGVAALRFSRGDELLAVLGPDDRTELSVPVGRHVITVFDGRGTHDHTIDVGPEGATLSPGCFADPFRSGGLEPLTLVGPDVACGPASVRARAGGLLVELAPGERQTLMLPRATHVVRVLEDGKKGRDATVELVAGGAELVLVACAPRASDAP